MILNGVVWLIIVALALPLIDKTDKWTRKAVKLMGSADDFIRKVLEDLFELIEKKNLQILAAFVLMIILGVLAQIGLIPKLITRSVHFRKNYFQVPYSLLSFLLSPKGPAIKIVMGLMPGSKSTRCKLSALLKPI